MKIGDLFPSRFTHGEDFDGEAKTVTITRVRMEEVYSPEAGRKSMAVVMETKELDRPVILRKTLAGQIAQALGDEEVDHWAGKRVELYPQAVNVGGARKIGIRARAARQNPAATSTSTVTAPAAATSTAATSTNTSTETAPTADLVINGKIFPAQIGPKDYNVYWSLARAVRLPVPKAKEIAESHKQDWPAAYQDLVARFQAGTINPIP